MMNNDERNTNNKKKGLAIVLSSAAVSSIVLSAGAMGAGDNAFLASDTPVESTQEVAEDAHANGLIRDAIERRKAEREAEKLPEVGDGGSGTITIDGEDYEISAVVVDSTDPEDTDTTGDKDTDTTVDAEDTDTDDAAVLKEKGRSDTASDPDWLYERKPIIGKEAGLSVDTDNIKVGRMLEYDYSTNKWNVLEEGKDFVMKTDANGRAVADFTDGRETIGKEYHYRAVAKDAIDYNGSARKYVDNPLYNPLSNSGGGRGGDSTPRQPIAPIPDIDDDGNIIETPTPSTPETPDNDRPTRPNTGETNTNPGTNDTVDENVNDNTNDATNVDPIGQDRTVRINTVVEAKDSITNVDALPEGTTFAWKETPDTSKVGDINAVVVVTYADGETKEVPVKITVTDDAVDPIGKDRTISLNSKPEAVKSIDNVDELPEGTTFAWKETPDTSTPGVVDAIVVSTYPDGATKETPVKLTVVDENVDPIGQNQIVKIGEQPKAEDSITNVDELPEGTTFTWKETPDTSTPGDVDATVVVTYPDGTSKEVPVTITVTDEVVDPIGQNQTVKVGDTPESKDSISNADELPEGTTFAWKETPDTSAPGDVDAIVVVTYPDGTTREVPVKVTVVADNDDDNNDNNIVEPIGQTQIVDRNSTPEAKDSIANVDDLPEGTTFEWKEIPDTSTPGDIDAIVVVTYPDGTTREVPVKITVNDDATVVDPIGQNQSVNVGDAPEVKDSISNVGDLPEGTTFAWKETPDTSKPGVVDAVVVVTYPGGTVKEVPVKITVNEVNDDIDPIGKNQTVDRNSTPDPKDSISNVGDFPEGTTFSWKKKPDTSKPGDVDAVVVVTFLDGSTKEVPVKITVLDDTDDDTNDNAVVEPVGKNQTVKVGQTPDPKDSIANVDDLPEGTTFAWKNLPDTSKIGDVDAIVVVTYPDGTTREVPVKITVDDDTNDDDTNDNAVVEPVGKNQTVKIGATPEAKDSIANVDKLPKGTTFAWKKAPDTSKAGEVDAIVVVTYPDGSTKEVPVKITVKAADVKKAQSSASNNANTASPAGKANNTAANNADVIYGPKVKTGGSVERQGFFAFLANIFK